MLTVQQKPPMERQRNNMRIIYSPRRSGKTTSAILQAARKNAIIICHNEASARHTLALAKKMGVSIRPPISCFSVDRLRGIRAPVIVDNAELVLQSLLRGTSIDTITLSSSRDRDY